MQKHQSLQQKIKRSENIPMKHSPLMVTHHYDRIATRVGSMETLSSILPMICY